MPPNQRPPSSGGVTGWSPETGPGLEEALDRLASEELVVEGRLPWSSNLTFLVTVGAGPDGLEGQPGGTDGVEPLRAVYKPASGEQDLWDFPDGLYRREVAAYALSEALAWGLVPPTVVREDAPFGPGSVQLFVEADYHQHYFTLVETDRHRDTLVAMCAFDLVANNADRKSGHVLEGPDGRLWGIDHGLCFHHQDKVRTVIWDFADEAVPAPLLADLEGLAADLPDPLGRLLPTTERRAMVDRIHRLSRAGVFPEPTGERPPYPWPLV
jgi:uncharacterized repeat protein (TIGR03843 family)